MTQGQLTLFWEQVSKPTSNMTGQNNKNKQTEVTNTDYSELSFSGHKYKQNK